MAGAAFPWGTFVVNVGGSFLLGLAVPFLQASAAGAEMRGFLVAGLLGAFTTFSTFTYESVVLAQAGHWGRAAAYTGGSLAVGLVAVVAGFGLASSLLLVRGLG